MLSLKMCCGKENSIKHINKKYIKNIQIFKDKKGETNTPL
jgi:hypothetical protein